MRELSFEMGFMPYVVTIAEKPHQTMQLRLILSILLLIMCGFSANKGGTSSGGSRLSVLIEQKGPMASTAGLMTTEGSTVSVSASR